jgi:hypothetical protein
MVLANCICKGCLPGLGRQGLGHSRPWSSGIAAEATAGMQATVLDQAHNCAELRLSGVMPYVSYKHHDSVNTIYMFYDVLPKSCQQIAPKQ